jgi:hypothetical protein
MSSDGMLFVRVFDGSSQSTAGSEGYPRQQYTKPQVGVIELQSHEVLGIGCKTQTSAGPTVLCNGCSSPGS